MQNEAASAVAAAAVKVSPPWIVTALAWGDENFPRILLALAIIHTAAQSYLAIRKIFWSKEE